jgi:glycerol-1-phosphate dehydrogenase [NAD(P)+]
MYARYGREVGRQCVAEFKRKALDPKKAAGVNRWLEENWENFAGKLRAIMLPSEKVQQALKEIGAPLTGRDLGLPQAFYWDVVLHSREVRDRFTMLDMAGDAGLLEGFADECT